MKQDTPKVIEETYPTEEEKEKCRQIVEAINLLNPVVKANLIPTLQKIEEKNNPPGNILASISNEINNLRYSFEENYFKKVSGEKACLGSFLFILAMIGAILNVPCFLTLDSSFISLRIIWRHLILVLLLIPKVFYDLSSLGDKMAKVFSSSNMFKIFSLSIINTIWLFMFYYAASHTFAAHTLLLQLPMLFLTFWKIITKETTTYVEIIGISTCILGAYWICNEGVTIDRRDIILGDLSSFFSSILGAIYINTASKIVDKTIPASVFLAMMGAYVIVISLILSAFVGESISFLSIDPIYGVFGLFSTVENIIYGCLGMGLLSGFALYYYSIKASEFVSPMFVNTTFNAAPFISQIICYILGVQGFPGSYTAYGGFWLFIGCTLLSMTYEDHKDMITQFPFYSEGELKEPKEPKELKELKDENEMKEMYQNVD